MRHWIKHNSPVIIVIAWFTFIGVLAWYLS